MRVGVLDIYWLKSTIGKLILSFLNIRMNIKDVLRTLKKIKLTGFGNNLTFPFKNFSILKPIKNQSTVYCSRMNLDGALVIRATIPGLPDLIH